MSPSFLNKDFNTHAKSLSRYASLVIALATAAVITRILWNSYLTFSFSPAVQQQTIPSTLASNDYSAGNIIQSNLFGDSKPVTSTENLPTTQLQLILRGAFTSTDPASASALIEGPDGKTSSFRVNSRVYGNSILHSVHSDRIVLSTNEQLETLFFPTLGSSPTTTTTAATQQIPDDIRELVQDNASASEIAATAKQLNSADMTEEQRQQLIRSRLQELRNRARK